MNIKIWLNRLIYKKLFKPVFFKIDPERVHDGITKTGEFLGRLKIGRWLVRTTFSYQDSCLEQELFGIKFVNPVGLSAGFDKDGRLYPIMESVGFGFAEVGTVTNLPYEGNPRPRLYRLPASEALVVYYGLKNEGVKKIASSLKIKERPISQIISIGRTNSREAASFEAGLADYFDCTKHLVEAGVGDIYEINISCPNTFGGEPFSDAESLEKLLQKIYSLNIQKPIFIKMPINLSWLEFKKLVDVALRFGVEALVIGNLNKDRSGKDIKDRIPEHVNGSISGKPTWDLSNQLISETYKYAGEKIKIIGVGGIRSAEDAYEKIRRGASLVELITGMIYQGPQLIGEINLGLTKLLKRDGFSHISEAVGTFNEL